MFNFEIMFQLWNLSIPKGGENNNIFSQGTDTWRVRVNLPMKYFIYLHFRENCTTLMVTTNTLPMRSVN